MGGGIRLKPLGMLSQPGSRTTLEELSDRDAEVGYALHRQRQGHWHWHVGASVSKFGDRNVPQESFLTIRAWTLRRGDLRIQRGGRPCCPRCPMGNRREGLLSGSRVSDVLQGLFPGIIGVPIQSEIRGDGDRLSVDIPNQQARRIQWQARIRTHPRPHGARSFGNSASNPYRPTLGYGPEPDSNLSLQLDERHVFAESRWEGIHGAFGFRVEHLDGRTSGWEFLLPTHLRTRVSAIADASGRPVGLDFGLMVKCVECGLHRAALRGRWYRRRG